MGNFLGKIGKILLSQQMIVISIVGGVLTGIYCKPLTPYLAPIGSSYMSLLMMCILPFIFASIVFGLANILRAEGAHLKLTNVALVFLGSMFLVALISLSVTLLLHDYIDLGPNAQNLLAGKMSSLGNEGVATGTTQFLAGEKLSYFLKQITPHNVFSALQEGLTIKVILIALLMGIALGKLSGKKTDYMIYLAEDTVMLFDKIFHWILKVLPIGLFCLFADNAAAFDASMFVGLIKIIGLIYLLSFGFILFYNFIVAWRLKISWFASFKIFKKPMFLIFASMSSTVAIPSSIAALRDFKINQRVLDLMIPLGFSINRQGNILVLSVAAILSVVFYGTSLTWDNLLLLFITVPLMGAFAFGGGVFLIPTFIFVSQISGVPATLGIVMITALDLFVAWVILIFTLYANYAAVAMVATNHHK